MEQIRVAFKKFRRVFQNVLTSGTFDKYSDDIDVYLKFLMVNAIGIVAGVCLLGYGILDIVRGVQPVGWIITGAGVVVVANFFLLRATKNYIFASWVATLILTFGFMFLLSTGGGGNTGPLWIYTLPGVALILLGIKAGSWLFFGFILYAIFVLFLPDSLLLFTEYPHDFVIRFIPTIITVLIMVYIFEAMRFLSQKSILEKNMELEDSLTRIKEAEQDLQKSEERYRSVAEDTPVLICRFLPGGEITYVNKAYCQYFKKTSEELVGSSFLSLIPEADRETVMANISALTVESPIQTHEHQVIAPGGEARWQRWTNHLMFDEKGHPVAVQAIGEDITKYKKDKEALQESQAKLLQAQYIAKIGDFTWDIASGKATWSNGLYHLLKYDRSEEIDLEKTNADIHHPDDLERITKWLKDGIASGKEVLTPNEYRLICKDGDVIHVQTNGRIEYRDGQAIKLFGTCQDITKRKIAEGELRHSQNLLKDVLDLVPDFICAKNLDGRFILANKKLADFYDITGEEMTGMLHADLCEDENELRAMLADDREVIESGKPKFIPEETMDNPDGSITILETYKIPFTAHGEAAVLIAASDITERKRAQHDLEKLKNSLAEQVTEKTEELRGRIEKSERSRKAMLYMVEDLNKTYRALQESRERALRSERLTAIGELSGGVAHELRNSLGVLTNVAAYLGIAVPSEDETVALNLRHMKDNINRANRIVTDLLDFSREVAPTKTEFSIRGLADEILKAMAVPENIVIESRPPRKQSRAVLADRDQIYLIIRNLIENAIDAMSAPYLDPPGGTITIDCAPAEEESWCLKITDTGCGIPAENRELIFEPLFTTKTRGIGLGLALSRRFVEINEGKLEVESEVDMGSTFILTLDNTDSHRSENR